MSAVTLMPEKKKLGSAYQGAMGNAVQYKLSSPSDFKNPDNLKVVMGYILPPWQRPFVWTQQQSISFMESVWLGIPIGTYTINVKYGSRYDGYLIDGQQRLRTIERYLDDEFSVFGYRWSEVTEIDRRLFKTINFAFFETNSDDETYLKKYYNLMNFGGTAHKESEKAI